MGLIKKIIIAISPMVVVFGANFFITYWTSFYTKNWESLFMHTVGGLVAAWGVYNLFNLFKGKFKLKIRPKWLFIVFLVGSVALIGILWEFYEFVHDQFSDFKYQLSLEDTMIDLVMDLVGVGLFCLILYVFKPKLCKD